VKRPPVLPSRALLALCSLLALLSLLLCPGRALAAPSLVLRGASGVVELVPRGSTHEASFEIENRGDAPAKVRARLLSSAQDTRLPPGMSVLLEGRGEQAKVAPGARQRVVVKWAPGSGRLREVYGHVVFEVEGGTELPVGVHGELGSGALGLLARHGLSIVVGLPLAGALIVLLLRLSRKDDRLAWVIAAVACALQLSIVAALFTLFDAGVGRADGNDGLQLIERAALLPSAGIEYFVAVDGASLPLLLLASLLGLAGALTGRRVELDRSGFFASYLLAVSAFSSAFVLLDLCLLSLAWALALGSLALVASRSPGARCAATTATVAVAAGLSSLLLGGAVVAISGHVGRALLADGSIVSRSFSLTSLLRADLIEPGATLLGLPLAAGAFSLLLGACALLLPLYPLQGWLSGLVSEAPTPARVLATGVVPALGCYGLVRVGLLVLPHGMLWAETTLAWMGALGLLAAGASAWGERDLRGLAGRSAAGSGALVLLALSTATPQGVEAALALAFAHGLAAAALAGLAGLLVDRVRTADATRLGGLLGEVPLLGGSIAVALLASALAPGLAGFWGLLLALLSAMVAHKAAAAAALLGVLLLGGAHLRLGASALLGQVPDGWRKSAYLEPFGGRFPDLSRHERLAFLPLLALLLALGLFPGPLLGTLERASLDHASFVSTPGPAQVQLRFSGFPSEPRRRYVRRHDATPLARAQRPAGGLRPAVPPPHPAPRARWWHGDPGQVPARGLRQRLEAPRHPEARQEAPLAAPDLPLPVQAHGHLRDVHG
jgi:NADH-quinone oxidoreductase subunit M